MKRVIGFWGFGVCPWIRVYPGVIWIMKRVREEGGGGDREGEGVQGIQPQFK